MKKYTLFAVMLIMALLLAACAPEDTEPVEVTPGFETTEPGIPGTGLDTPTPGFDTPLATPTVMATVEVTPEVTPEVTAVITPTVEATPGTGVGTDGDAVVLVDDHPARATVLIGMRVQNMQDEDLGEINDLIVNVQQERVVYAVLGVGGLLGIGERSIAVPFEALNIQTDPDDADDWIIVLDVDEEALDNAPEIDLDVIDFTTPDWDVNFDVDWVEGGVVVQTTPAPGTTETPAQATPAPGVQVTPGMAGTAPQAIRMSVLLDADVETRDVETTGTAGTTQETPVAGAQATPTLGAGTVVVDRDDIGDVQEVLIDLDTGDILYVVVDPDDAMDLDEVWIPIPLSQLEIIHDEDADWVGGENLVILMERGMLVGAPTFEAGAIPDIDLPNWDADFRVYWDVQ